MNRFLTIVVSCVMGAGAAGAAADIDLRTDVPGASSSATAPFSLDIFNGAGVAFRVDVTDITRGMTPEAKAGRIRAAIMTQAPAFLRVSGGASVILNNSAKKVKLVADPTKEDFDKLNANSLALASFGGSGTGTGLDPDGNASIVRCGIEGLYIAEVAVTASMSSSQILSSLRSMLSSNGIAAQLNSDQTEITLTDLVSPGQNFVIGSSDTGFNMQAQYEAVPAPAGAGVLLASGLVLLRRRRR